MTNAPAFVDADAGDYRLSDKSPCVDAGRLRNWMKKAVDLDGNQRVTGKTVDIGAYEYGPAGPITPDRQVCRFSAPPTIDGTTDWEVLFENDEQGLFAIVAATQTPAQLKQITEDIIRALFSRKQDQPVLGKVTAFLEKLIPEDASEDRFPVMQVTVKELLGANPGLPKAAGWGVDCRIFSR